MILCLMAQPLEGRTTTKPVAPGWRYDERLDALIFRSPEDGMYVEQVLPLRKQKRVIIAEYPIAFTEGPPLKFLYRQNILRRKTS